MNSISVRDLMITGESGGLAIGVRLDDVIATLGEPGDRAQITPLILSYGSLELTFVDGVVVLIAHYPDRFAPAGAGGVQDDLPRSLSDVTAILRVHELGLAVDDELSYDNQRAFKLKGGSGASLLFDDACLTSVQIPGSPGGSR